MKNRTIAIIMVAAAFGSGFCLPASAQSSIGGAKKQTPLAAPVKQPPLGGPAKPSPMVGQAKPVTRRPRQQAGRCLSVTVEVPCTALWRQKRSALAERTNTVENKEQAISYNRMPLARMASASSAAGPRRARRAPSSTNSTSRDRADRDHRPFAQGPPGSGPCGTTVTPRPASAAARKPLRLPLVQTMRQARPLAPAPPARSRG